MATPHNQAEMGEIAKTVLMPGDPLRAKFIADTFLENPVQFNTVRNMFGYTGTYNGKKISVMASGMGIPSIAIYAYELYKFYGVENIIRIGTTGAYHEDIELFDVILATGAYSESTFAKYFCGKEDKIQKPSPELVDDIREAANRLGEKIREGLVFSADQFYHVGEWDDYALKTALDNNLIAAEMESFGLFSIANALGKKAACMLTVSDNIITHKETTSEERRSHLIDMIKIALEAVKEY